MPFNKFEIRELKDGIKSLRLIENQETFHPEIGPMAEARILHVEQHRLRERVAETRSFVLWDVGLGAAANAIAAVEAMSDCSADVEIHSFDRNTDAIRFALSRTEDLDYLQGYGPALECLIEQRDIRIKPKIRWVFHLGDFRHEMLRSEIPAPDAVFYDPYSPRGNVDMWNLEHFQALRRRLVKPCLLSNYTRATSTRVTWLLAGFSVGIGVAIGKKEESSLAATDIRLLEKPLPTSWLKRVRVSHSAAPLRGQLYSTGPISSDDYSDLANLPQFRD